MVEDKDIERVQRSTRTLFPALIPLHDKLRMKYSWYYKWHLWRHAKTVHLAVLFLYILALSSFGFLSYKTAEPTTVKAAANTTSWTVSDAGSADYNGSYTYAGTDPIGGFDYWQLGSTAHYLFYSLAAAGYHLAPAVTNMPCAPDCAYRENNGQLPSNGNWATLAGGTNPAPSVAALGNTGQLYYPSGASDPNANGWYAYASQYYTGYPLYKNINNYYLFGAGASGIRYISNQFPPTGNSCAYKNTTSFEGQYVIELALPPAPFVIESPSECLQFWVPVCGENGQTYTNSCAALADGVNVQCQGECPCSVSPTPTPTPTPTPSPTETPTSTETSTSTPTPTPTPTSTSTLTPTPTPTLTPTSIPSPTPTAIKSDYHPYISGIYGTVTDNNGNPIAGVTIIATSNGQAAVITTTASDGTYSITSATFGEWTITPSNAGYTFSPASQSVSWYDVVDNVNFTVTQTPPPGPTETSTSIVNPTTPVSQPSSPSSCVLGSITQVSIDPTESTVNPGQIQALGIIFKDASGNPVARDSVSGFKITPDFDGSYWRVDPSIGGTQSENINALQIRIVGGNVAGSHPNEIIFSACGGTLKALANLTMTGSNGLGDNFRTIIGNTVLAARNVASSPATTAIESAVAALALAATVVASSFPVVVSIATYMAKLADILRYPAAFLGMKKRSSKWGIVYDSVNKRPIEKAKIQIFSEDGRLRETQFTSERGSFGFLVPAGKYKIVVTKSGYIFPSNIVPGTADEQYQDVYHGKTIEIKGTGGKTVSRSMINLSIPLDQTKMKIATVALTSTIRSIQRFFGFIRLPVLIIGTLLTIHLVSISPNSLNIVIAVIYALLWFFEVRRLVSPKAYGTIKDNAENPLSLAIVRALDTSGRVKATVITGDDGKFTLNLQQGTYYFDATRLGYKPDRSEKIMVKKLSDIGKVNLVLKREVKA